MLGSRAIVIGAGIAGLSAAAALLDHFENILILERDPAAMDARPRAGVPQGHQPHLLLCGGAAALHQLFPGFDADTIAGGGIPYNPSSQLPSEIPGYALLPRRDFGFRSVAMRRPLLESVLGARLVGHRRVQLKAGMRALRIRLSADGAKVTGVEVVDRAGNIGFESADLVIDASSQGALTIAALDQSGRMPPPTEVVGVDIGYSSAVFSIPDFQPDAVGLATHPAQGSSRMGYMIRLSGHEWHVLLVGRGDDQPPAEIKSFLDFARSFATPTIANALKLATSFDAFRRFRFPASIRRRFVGASELPAGLLPLGDAMCRVNPIYGQGMTIAAQEALLLRRLLERRTARSASDLTRQYLAGCELIIDPAWSFSVIPDFAFDATVGKRPADLQDHLARRDQTLRRAVDDADTHRAFIEAMHLLPTADADLVLDALNPPLRAHG